MTSTRGSNWSVVLRRRRLKEHWAWWQRGRTGPGRIELEDQDLRGAKLVDLDGARLVGCDLSHSELPVASLREIELERCRFVEVGMNMSHLDQATVVACTFERAIMHIIHFEGATLRECGFERAEMQRSQWDEARVDACTFEATDLIDASFQSSVFTDCSFHGALLSRNLDHLAQTTGAVFVRCDFSGADLNRRILRGASFEQCTFTNVKGAPEVDSTCIVVDPKVDGDMPDWLSKCGTGSITVPAQPAPSKPAEVVPAGPPAGNKPDDRAMVEVPGGVVQLGLSEDEAAQLARELTVMEQTLLDERQHLDGHRFDFDETLRARLEWLRTAMPVQAVELAAFSIDRYPVTVAQYAAYMAESGAREPSTWNRGQPPGDHFVTGISWREANAYAAYYGLQLPDEAHWERAARGGDRRFFPWGSSYFAQGRIAFPEDGADVAWAVGSRPALASPYGVEDLIGEFGEYTSEAFCPYEATDLSLFERHFPNWRKERAVRGGYDVYQDSTCVYRNGIPEDDRAYDMKFRCVRVVQPKGRRLLG